jgi:ribosomal-protein-serine acetyltransferase
VRLPDLLPRDLGAGLVLHATTIADADEAFAVVDAERDRLRDWLPWVDGTGSVDVEREFLASVEAGNTVGTAVGLTLRVDGGFAGLLGLRIDGMHDSVEVGYWLASAYLGRGLITRSVAASIDLAFGPLGLHRFQLRAATGNRRSRAVAERLGMTHEGTLRDAELLADGYVDLELYSLLSTEWPALRPAVS